MAASSEGDTLSDPRALVATLADSLAEVEAETLGDTVRDAYALVKSLADMEEEVAA